MTDYITTLRLFFPYFVIGKRWQHHFLLVPRYFVVVVKNLLRVYSVHYYTSELNWTDWFEGLHLTCWHVPTFHHDSNSSVFYCLCIRLRPRTCWKSGFPHWFCKFRRFIAWISMQMHVDRRGALYVRCSLMYILFYSFFGIGYIFLVVVNQFSIEFGAIKNN